MTARFVLFLSRRMLRGRAGSARYLRGAVLGIALSLVPLVVVMEVSTGMIDGITARLLEVGTYHLQVPFPPETPVEVLAAAADAIGRVKDVIAAVPERQGTGMLVAARGAAGVNLRFVAPDVFTRDTGFRSFMTIRSGTTDLSGGSAPGAQGGNAPGAQGRNAPGAQGRNAPGAQGRNAPGAQGGDAVLVSAALAATLGVGPGDTVNILTTWGEDLSGPPRLTPVPVAGIYETGYQELDAALAYAPITLADRILSPRSSRAFIGVKVKDPFVDLAPLAREVAAAAGGEARVATWRQIEYARLESFRTTKALLLFIMALVVAVASVNVSSAVMMIIIERRHDLGILKSVGAGPRPLSLSFLLAGFGTGLMGTFAGVAFGLLVSVNINEVIAGMEWVVNRFLMLASFMRTTLVPSEPAFGAFTLFNSAYYLKSIPIRIDPAEIIVAAASTLLLSSLASYLPARRASRIKPLEILRKV